MWFRMGIGPWNALHVRATGATQVMTSLWQPVKHILLASLLISQRKQHSSMAPWKRNLIQKAPEICSWAATKNILKGWQANFAWPFGQFRWLFGPRGPSEPLRQSNHNSSLGPPLCMAAIRSTPTGRQKKQCCLLYVYVYVGVQESKGKTDSSGKKCKKVHKEMQGRMTNKTGVQIMYAYMHIIYNCP